MFVVYTSSGFDLVEFTYDDLAKATAEFRLINKIGQFGFGVVYCRELKGAGKTL